MDGSVENLGNTRLSFSPDVIFNNIFTFNYRGLKASVQSQYIGDQYLTNTGFKSYQTLDNQGKTTDVSMILDAHFNTNIDLSYTFALKQVGVKDVTLGVTLYNIFSAKYDNNGWAAPAFVKQNGQVVATGWDTSDLYEAGFAPSAPFNLMAHLAINF
jgi:iron complex outermembrane receptor protein